MFGDTLYLTCYPLPRLSLSLSLSLSITRLRDSRDEVLPGRAAVLTMPRKEDRVDQRELVRSGGDLTYDPAGRAQETPEGRQRRV